MTKAFVVGERVGVRRADGSPWFIGEVLAVREQDGSVVDASVKPGHVKVYQRGDGAHQVPVEQVAPRRARP